MNEIISASYEMGRARTGALIVLENESSLEEFAIIEPVEFFIIFIDNVWNELFYAG